MPTANDHIDRAASMIGASSPVKPMSAATRKECLQTYNDMVAEWIDEGIEVFFVQADTNGDEVYNDEWASPAIQYNLAVLIAPICQVDAPPVVTKKAGELYARARRRTRLKKNIPERVTYPSRLPRGAGASRGSRYIARFYPEPEE